MSKEFDKEFEAEMAKNMAKAKAENQVKLNEMQKQAIAMLESQRGMMISMGMSPEAADAQIEMTKAQILSASIDGASPNYDMAHNDDDDNDDADEENEVDEEREADKAEFTASHPQPEGKTKYLALGSFFVAMRDEPLETIELMDDADDYVEEMESSWGIDDRESALDMIESLLGGRAYNMYNETYLELKAGKTDEHQDDVEDYQATIEGLQEVLGISEQEIAKCPSIWAWDIERAGYMVRTSLCAEYISNDEAWAFLERAAALAKANFSSWTDYAVSIVMGRAVHMGFNVGYFYAMHELLAENPDFLNERPISSL